MGEFKWKELRMPYRLADTPAPSPEAVAAVRDVFAARGLTVV
jgi:pyruvate formate lyase activating enzyme